MERYLFMKTVLDRLAQGPLFRTYFSLALKVLAAVIAIAGLVGFVSACNFTFKQEPARILGGIVYLLALVAGVYMAVHAILIRANEIAGLPETGFTAIPVVSVAARMTGEAYAAFCAAIAVGGGVLIWFTEGSAATVLHDVSRFVPGPVEGTFPGGLRYIVRGLVASLVALVAGRLLSELLTAVEKISGKS